MKLTTRILSLLVLSGLVMFFAGCDKENNKKKSEAEKQFDKLKASWELVSATDDTGDRTDDFSDPFVLTITGSFAEDGEYNYSFAGQSPEPSPWAESGVWKFGADPSSDIIRDPETDYERNLTYTVTDTDTDTELEINFTIPDGDPGFPGFGRVGSVSGNWTFVFSKQ